MKNILLLMFILGTASTVLSQNRLHVNPLAGGQNNGSSWADAFTDLHDALALAVAGDEIWVAAGTYRPSAAGDRSARYQMLSGVRLYGGFAGTEIDLSERDWAAHPTVLDGDIGVPGDSADNSRNLLYLYRPDSLTLVDGLTFRHAVADDPAAPFGTVGSSGAALYIMALDGEAYPTVRHCAFERNTALGHGGAVYVNGGGSGSAAPVFDGCRFEHNRAAEGSGGALYRNGGSWVDRPEDITRCVFEGNMANRQGGAIFFRDSPRSDTFDIAHTKLHRNKISFHDVGINGAAIQIASPRLNDVTTLCLKNSKISDHDIFAGAGTSTLALEIGIGFQSGNFVLKIDSTTFENNIGGSNFDVLGWSQLIVKNSSFLNESMPGLVSGIRWYGEPSSKHSFLENIIIAMVRNDFAVT